MLIISSGLHVSNKHTLCHDSTVAHRNALVIYMAIVMSVIEEISKLSRNGCDDALLNYICENYDEIELIFALTATWKR